MTSPEHKSGTDRVAEICMNFPNFYYIVNVQADEPFMKVDIIDKIFGALEDDNDSHIITAITECKEDDLNNINVVKVVFDKNFHALYFSRSPIPFSMNKKANYYKHIGIYGFKRDSLFSFINLGYSYLEEVEGLEQLRALEYNMKIKCIVVDYDGFSIDTYEDYEKALKFFGV
jgi:3-deoxy-manno-octulosonate cytidylyltransferase (CMP-KDO synthetase)